MLPDFPNDSFEPSLKHKQLQLARKHAYEWKHYFTLARSDRFALEVEHKKEINRTKITVNYKELSALLARQCRQLKKFRQEQDLIRQSIMIGQIQEKADLLRDK